MTTGAPEMEPSPARQVETQDRMASHWARPVDQLMVEKSSQGPYSINVDGRRLTGPLWGFGQMWQKTYRVRLSGVPVTPGEVIATWKADFPRFWAKGTYFNTARAGLNPGDIALIGAQAPGQIPLFSTAVEVIYADKESFTFMTPEGHPFAGWVTFSAYEERGSTVVQVQVLIRASDPLYELGFRLGLLHYAEDQVWHHTLGSLASHYGLQGQVHQQVTCVDPKIQWSQAGNIWYNSAIRSILYSPVALLRRLTGSIQSVD